MKIKKVLIIRFGAIGDVVHTTGLYRAIKQKMPDVEIHYLTSSFIKPLLEADKDVSKIISLQGKLKLFSQQTKEIINLIKQENYDVIFNLQPSFKTKMICFLSGAKIVTYKKDFKMHAIKNFWQTGLKVFPDLKEISDVKLYLPEKLIDEAKEKVKDLKRPIVVINAGGMFSKRQGRSYPIEKWIELGNRIENEKGGTIILNGASEDRNFLLPLEKIKNSLNFIGELSLEQSCALISQADLMLSGDSGPLHIACALGVKSIGLYGSMPVNRTGCSCTNIVSKKDCVPCNRRKCKYLRGKKEIYTPCMKEIEVDSILKKVFELV